MAAMKAAQPEVLVGQIWQDWDSRVRHMGGGLHYRVMEIDGHVAMVSRCAPNGRLFDEKRRPLLIRRLRPNSTGYRLIYPKQETR